LLDRFLLPSTSTLFLLTDFTVPFWMRSISFRFGFGRDVKLLISSMGVASLAGSFARVVQGIYLAMLGVSPVLIGLLASLALVAAALRNVIFGVLSDKIGRRWVLFVVFLTSVAHNLIYFFAVDYAFFALAAVIGGAGGEGFGGYVEGAFLAEKAGDAKRTLAFSVQYFVASSFAAVGSFASGLPESVSEVLGIPLLDSIRLFYLLQAALCLGASLLILAARDSPRGEGRRKGRYLSSESRKRILKFSILGAVDGFGIGMIVDLFSLWFYMRFGIGIATVGYIFTASRIVETFFYLMGLPISKRFGLINTIRFARLGGAISVGLLPFMPTYTLAALMYVARNSIQHISIPLRTSYTMAIFNREERASAASISNLGNTAAHTISSTLAGYLMENVNIMLPPLISGVFVGVASQLYYVFFRNIRPPEEREHS